MERKTQWIEVKFDNSQEGDSMLSGYASVKGVVDSYGDVIMDGAYTNLEYFIDGGFVAIGHDHVGLPIGYILSAHEDDHGLFVSMAFHTSFKAEQARIVVNERLKAGKKVGLSIGYLPIEWTFENREDKRVRLLKKIELKEFSIVSLPATLGAEVNPKGDRVSLSEINTLAEAWEKQKREMSKNVVTKLTE